MSATRPPAEWRYLLRGTVVHAAGLWPGAPIVSTAPCGIGPWTASGWLGSGDQDEYERAAHLPACRRCVRKLGG